MADAPSTPAEPAATATPASNPEPAELGDAGKKALAEERKARHAAEKSAEAALAKLRELEDAGRSDLEKANARVAQLEYEKQETDQRLLRAEVAHANGLTAEQARRLVGETREELEADAKALLALFNPPTPGQEPRGFPDLGQGARGGGATPLNGDPLERALKQKLGIS